MKGISSLDVAYVEKKLFMLNVHKCFNPFYLNDPCDFRNKFISKV